MIDKTLVGQRIFSLRKKAGITQDELAKLVNVTPQAISKWENGAALPDTCLLPVLSELFHVSIEELLCTNNEYTQAKHKESDPVLLPGFTYYPCTPSLVSCIKSSLDYLGIHVSTGWISAPYTFMLNINDEVSYKGPEFWNDNGCFDELIRNCGGIVENLHGLTGDSNFNEQRKEAWNMLRDSINKGLPCYVWWMDKPQYYLIAGYDEEGCYYIDPESRKAVGPKPYSELGENGWGVLEIHIIRPGSISDNLKTLKDIFEYAINVGSPDIHKPNSGYTMGINAYQIWWEAICSGRADQYGIAYNSAFWANCKKLAVLFLQEGKLRIGIMEDLFDRAIMNYKCTANSLSRLSRLFPLNAAGNYRENRELTVEAARLLKSAQKSEAQGLTEIRHILNGIYKLW